MKKNISRSNFENLIGQFLDDTFVKINADPKETNAQESFLLLSFSFLIPGYLRK